MENTVVLVVESEALIRIDAVQTLEDAGYTVFDACNANEAISILESHSDVRVVITDINMTGSMDGLKLAHAIRRRWPPIHLIVTSGRSVAAMAELPAKARFILKPYDSTRVVTALRELLSAD